MHSETFCVLPWIHLGAKPDGSLNLCCFASHIHLKNADGENIKLNRDSISSAWNSPTLVEVRKDMLAGKKISGCEICYKDEDNQKRSHRQSINNEWTYRLGEQEIADRVGESQELHGLLLKSKPIYFDLRLGNTCNLRCRMCFPLNSNSLNTEFSQILAKKMPFPEFYERQILPTNVRLNWSDSEIFLKNIKAHLSDIKELYFTGGEPMLISAVAEILTMAMEMGVSQQISLKFHTNTTHWNQEIISLLPYFKKVSLNCSIDGVHHIDEYVRYPTQFEAVDKNFRKYNSLVEQYPNLDMGMATTVSWMNIFELPQLFDWVLNIVNKKSSSFWGISLNQVYYPTHLALEMIPDEQKKAAITSLQTCLDLLKSHDYQKQQIEHDLNALVYSLSRPFVPNSFLTKELVQFTETLDKQRNQSLKKTSPSANEVFRYHKNLFDS